MQLRRRLPGCLGRELTLELGLILRQFLQQVRRDRQAIAARQRLDLAGVAEGGAHHDGLDPVRLVIGVDLAHREDARVGLARVVLARGRLVPVEDAADEWRDEEGAGVRSGDRLREREHQRKIAVDAFLLEGSRSLDALPSGSELDENALAPDAAFLVVGDQRARLVDHGVAVERQIGVDFRRDAAGHDLGQLRSEIDREPVGDAARHALMAAAPDDRLLHEVLVLRHARRLQDQRGVGGAIRGAEGADRFHVAGVGDDGRHGLELFELGSHVRLLAGFISDELAREAMGEVAHEIVHQPHACEIADVVVGHDPVGADHALPG